jgi:hypothetical protein
MSDVFDTDIECPVCYGNFAHTDFEIRTNEREFDCERCGYGGIAGTIETVESIGAWFEAGKAQ